MLKIIMSFCCVFMGTAGVLGMDKVSPRSNWADEFRKELDTLRTLQCHPDDAGKDPMVSALELLSWNKDLKKASTVVGDQMYYAQDAVRFEGVTLREQRAPFKKVVDLIKKGDKIGACQGVRAMVKENKKKQADKKAMDPAFWAQHEKA